MTPSSRQQSRRRLVLASGEVLLLGVLPLRSLMAKAAPQSQVLAVRSWPASDYSRITLEYQGPALVHKTQTLTGPDRLVVDLSGLQLNPALSSLVARLQPNDPYLSGVRVSQFQPDVVRLVFDLRQPVLPKVFTLPPVDRYASRLVLDLYPLEDNDPLMALLSLNEASEPEAPSAPAGTSRSAPGKPRPGKAVPPIVVALDPGHGGEDPGAIGRGGTQEKQVVLQVARQVQAELERQGNLRVVLTRDGDYFVPLHRRVQKARAARADVLVSIHADAWISREARGASVFVLSEKGATSAAARWMAQKENGSDAIGGVSFSRRDEQLARVLLDLSTTAQIRDSLVLGKALLREMGGVGQLHKRQVEQAGFAVLKAPDLPSVLVETAFISNPEEERRLASADYQAKVARAIARGLLRYLGEAPATRSRLA